jgi:hypothetical protein
MVYSRHRPTWVYYLIVYYIYIFKLKISQQEVFKFKLIKKVVPSLEKVCNKFYGNNKGRIGGLS